MYNRHTNDKLTDRLNSKANIIIDISTILPQLDAIGIVLRTISHDM